MVSFAAQYRMVLAAKNIPAVSALEAGIPDVAALIFATLGIALALHGRRALRPRFLNLAAVATSVTMNVLAAGPGWRDLAIWVMPPAAYALASDTAIGVIRARTLALQSASADPLADEAATPLAIVGGLLLWLLRLALAPPSTLSGFRRWVIEECPAAPAPRAPQLPTSPPPASPPPKPAPRPASSPAPRVRPGSKTGRFLALVTARYGPLAAFPLADVSPVSTELAPEVGLDPGAARSALRRHVQAARATTTPASPPPATSPLNGSAR